MKKTFLSDQFIEDDGSYYSSSFKLDELDSMMTLGVWLATSGTASLEISLDEEDWLLLEDSTITCNTYGIQTFVDVHHSAFYRIVTDAEVEKAIILV